MGRFIAVIAASVSLFFLSVAPVTEAEPTIEPVANVAQPPEGPAPAWIVADMDTGQVLAERDMNIPHPPASTIKTLLVVTALDELPDLDTTVVGTEADTHVECSCVGIEPGRTYTARQLLDAILLMSGNDAANALADMIGGYDTAVAKMNAKAASLGAPGTHASTPSGLDGPGGSGATTPRDLAVIFRAAMANPVIAQIIAQPAATFPTDAGDKPIVNDDELLHRYPGILGGKTGFTDAARKTFVAAADRGGRRLVIAMMYGLIKEGGPTYWDQAMSLFDWGFAQDGRVSVASL
jgi:D-alanyl-D-alanine carboxypeptidase (penicillin-binding protein 5/6)